jgi:glycosyltransferase involved in cell wall biosynthesis
LSVLTPDAGQWRGLFDRADAAVGSAPAAAMPERVAAHHVGLSLRRPDISNRAATPTKIGEFLAAGRPVAVSPGLGDMDVLLARHHAGVVVADATDASLDRAATQLEELVDDADTPKRCRALAEEHFDLERGVDQLIDAYRAAALGGS